MTRNLLKVVIEERFDLVETMLDDINQSDNREYRDDLTYQVMQIVDGELDELAGESRAYWLMTGGNHEQA